jgi:hypothetical protein
LNVGEDAVELIERMVRHDELSLACAGVLDLHDGA